MNKSLCIALAGVAFIVTALYAADSFDNGIVREVSTTRYNPYKVGEEADASTQTVITNVITANPAVIGKIIIPPNDAQNRIRVYNATTVSNTAASKLIFDTGATNINPLIVTIHDLAPGLAGTNGIVVLSTRGDTNNHVTGFIMWDKTRP